MPQTQNRHDAATPHRQNQVNLMNCQEWVCLVNKDVAKILEGDVSYKITVGNQEFDVGLPYLTGSQICDVASQFGFKMSVNNSSRWQMMEILIDVAIQKRTVGKLISSMFMRERYSHIGNCSHDETIQNEIFSLLLKSALTDINKHIVFSGKKLEVVNNQAWLSSIEDSLVPAENNKYTSDYVRSYPKRIKKDLDDCFYDSVVTKSRTYIEETCIFILEQKGLLHSEKGDVEKLYDECKASLKMKRSSEWNNLVSDLVNGLNKIVKSIGTMRNKNSDSHGAGSKRFSIPQREARLIANASITLCDYLLSVFESQKN